MTAADPDVLASLLRRFIRSPLYVTPADQLHERAQERLRAGGCVATVMGLDITAVELDAIHTIFEETS